MKVSYTNPYSNRKFEYASVHHAVKEFFEPTFADGTVERIKEKVDNQALFIGRLTEILVKKNILGKEELEWLLGDGYELKND